MLLVMLSTYSHLTSQHHWETQTFVYCWSSLQTSRHRGLLYKSLIACHSDQQAVPVWSRWTVDDGAYRSSEHWRSLLLYKNLWPTERSLVKFIESWVSCGAINRHYSWASAERSANTKPELVVFKPHTNKSASLRHKLTVSQLHSELLHWVYLRSEEKQRAIHVVISDSDDSKNMLLATVIHNISCIHAFNIIQE